LRASPKTTLTFYDGVGANRDFGIVCAPGSSNVRLEKWSGQSTVTEHPRIALVPDVLAGKPVIRGTRLSVEFVIGLMADGRSEADILGNYPGITHDDIIACLAYARDTLSSEKVFPSAAMWGLDQRGRAPTLLDEPAQLRNHAAAQSQEAE
jgi:uncharacterized protein (DUF433 family)